jgi:hypothetical protein
MSFLLIARAGIDVLRVMRRVGFASIRLFGFGLKGSTGLRAFTAQQASSVARFGAIRPTICFLQIDPFSHDSSDKRGGTTAPPRDGRRTLEASCSLYVKGRSVKLPAHGVA